MTFENVIGRREGYILTVDSYGDDDGTRRLMAPFSWGEINANGDALTNRYYRFASGSAPGTRHVDRTSHVRHSVLDEDPARLFVTSYGIISWRQDDEIVAQFNLRRYFWPGGLWGYVVSTVEASTTINV